MIEKNEENSMVTQLLKDRYFEIALKEDLPNTPDITLELDKIEKAIRTQNEQRVSDHR
jgi:hypothetical protein